MQRAPELLRNAPGVATPAVATRAAPFLPMTRAEMDVLGWERCDVIIVTGDAYVDQPSFGMAIIEIGRAHV